MTWSLFGSKQALLPGPETDPGRIHISCELDRLGYEHTVETVAPGKHMAIIDMGPGVDLVITMDSTSGALQSSIHLLEGEPWDEVPFVIGPANSARRVVLREECTDLTELCDALSQWVTMYAECSQDELRRQYHMGRWHEYRDSHSTVQGQARCDRVVFSERAMAVILSESRSCDPMETGGILLGNVADGVWYVVEATDPGLDAQFLHSHHESDRAYINHLMYKESRLYARPLILLGLWHRHPGSLDTFSYDDDRTNGAFSESIGMGCISGLVNYDPDFRITMYHCSGDRGKVSYRKVKVDVGDELGEMAEMTRLASAEEILERDDWLKESEANRKRIVDEVRRGQI